MKEKSWEDIDCPNGCPVKDYCDWVNGPRGGAKAPGDPPCATFDTPEEAEAIV